MVFRRNSHLNTIFFVISAKMMFLFSRKYGIFSLCRKWKRMIFIKKTPGNMFFSVYMRRRYKHDIALLAKKQRYPCPEKIHLGVASPTSPKKMIFILENKVFFLKYYIDWHREKGPIRSYRRCSTQKGVLRNFAKLTEKDLCQDLLFNKITGLQGLQLY